jgi:UDP-3-O-[3-hydroxymyristoyl] glucosamine N-acyltransferase
MQKNILNNFNIKNIGFKKNLVLKTVSTNINPQDNSIFYTKQIEKDIVNFLNVKNCLIICNNTKIDIDIIKNNNNIVMTSHNPRYSFAKILEIIINYNNKHKLNLNHSFFGKNIKIGLNTNIDDGVYIGNNVIIGNNTSIKKNVYIGNNVIIGDSVIIGHAGFGFEKYNNDIVHVPHVGGVRIEDDVYIGNLITIASGVIEETYIGRKTKIDDHVHIGHNAKIGEECIITACSEICRSDIGNNVWIGPNSNIKQGVVIGDNVKIGIGSNVIKNIENNKVLCGNPAEDIDSFMMKREYLKKIYKQKEI